MKKTLNNLVSIMPLTLSVIIPQPWLSTNFMISLNKRNRKKTQGRKREVEKEEYSSHNIFSSSPFVCFSYGLFSFCMRLFL